EISDIQVLRRINSDASDEWAQSAIRCQTSLHIERAESGPIPCDSAENTLGRHFTDSPVLSVGDVQVVLRIHREARGEIQLDTCRDTRQAVEARDTGSRKRREHARRRSSHYDCPIRI